MKIRNIIAAIILSICIAVMPSASVSASDYVGLITKCSLNCSYSDGMLKIYAKTQASGTMDKIGFVNIIIQKSSDLKNWTDEKSIGDFVKSDKKYYTLEHSEKIAGGFYYRILCTHYASGIPFGSTETELQTAENTSKYVWADAMPLVTHAVTTTAKPTTTSATTAIYNQENISAPTTSGTTKTIKTITATAAHINRNDTATSPKTSTTASAEKTTLSKNAPTGVNLPLSAMTVSAAAVVTAFLSRKKSK